MCFINIQCSRAMQPNFLFSWPNARVGVASPDHIMEALTVRELLLFNNCINNHMSLRVAMIQMKTCDKSMIIPIALLLYIIVYLLM